LTPKVSNTLPESSPSLTRLAKSSHLSPIRLPQLKQRTGMMMTDSPPRLLAIAFVNQLNFIVSVCLQRRKNFRTQRIDGLVEGENRAKSVLEAANVLDRGRNTLCFDRANSCKRKRTGRLLDLRTSLRLKHTMIFVGVGGFLLLAGLLTWWIPFIGLFGIVGALLGFVNGKPAAIPNSSRAHHKG